MPQHLVEPIDLDDYDAPTQVIATGKADKLAGITGQVKDTTPGSATALVTDAFLNRRGAELVNEAEATIGRKLDATPEEMADMYAACFEREPALVKKCMSPERRQYMEQLLADPTVAAVRTSSTSNDAVSEVAAYALTDEWVKFRTTMNIDNPTAPRRSNRSPASARGTGKPPVDLSSSVEALRSVAVAASRCSAMVQDYHDCCDALGGGAGCGGAGGAAHNFIDPKTAMATFKRLKNSETLSNIAKLAGRYRRMAAAKQRMKVSHGIDDMVGITTGGDLAAILPGELMKLDDPDFGDEALYRLAERQMMQRQHRGCEPAGKGPIVVIVDESGSMTGSKIENAKALALALAWISRKQRRWCAMVGFSGGTDGHRLMLPPGKWDQTKLMDWMEHFYGGGTNMDVPLVQLPTIYWPEFMASGASPGKTDLIMLTDGEVDLDLETERGFMAWKKKEQVRLYTLLIDSSADGHLEAISDQFFKVASKDLNAEGEAVGAVLSI